MDRASVPFTENKILLLAILDKFNIPLTNLQVLEFIVKNEIMDYIDTQLSLAELTEAGLLRLTPDAESKRVYSLTNSGVGVLDMFKKRVPNSRYQQAIDKVVSWRKVFHQRRNINSTYKKNNGFYDVYLKACDDGMRLIDITLTMPDRESAKQICENWQEKAAHVYKTTMTILTDNNEKSDS